MLVPFRRLAACAGGALLAACSALHWIGSPQVGGALASGHRTPELRAQDPVRRPLQTLEFFGLEPDHTVIEVWPEDGYYTEILAPLLHDEGEYYAAGYPVTSSKARPWQRESMLLLLQKLSARPELYGRVRLVELGPPSSWQVGRGGADLAFSDGHFHAWLAGDYEQRMMRALHAALKPGGILGIVEPRAEPKTSRAQSLKTGYVTEERVIAAARRAGFRLEGRSEINANPGDDRKPAGKVRAGHRDRRANPDRMTLRFVKGGARKARR